MNYPFHFNAAVLENNNSPLVIHKIKFEGPLKAGQVLVRLFYSGICGKQIEEIDGLGGADHYIPHLLGHEGSGEVLAVGPAVNKVKPGDTVVLHWMKGSGIHSETPYYESEGKRINAGWVTTFNEKAVVSENRLTVIPKDFNMRLAPLFGCAVTTAFGVVNNDAKIKVGQSVLIFGVGGVGLNIAQAASMVSAYPIIGVDLHQNKLDLGKRFGLTHGVLATSSNDIKKEIFNILGERGADATIETTGNSRVIEQAYDFTSSEGKLILVGVTNKNDKISIYTLPLHFNKILTGSHGGNSVPDIDIPRYIRLINSNKMTLENLITHEFRLEQINEALDLFRSGKAGRIIINMSS